MTSEIQNVIVTRAWARKLLDGLDCAKYKLPRVGKTLYVNFPGRTLITIVRVGTKGHVYDVTVKYGA